ncbi:MAG: TolC family protein, partial [Planctomycetes bacterium]|nr:TolC family protein [Planctomycetota bacterium]
QRRVELARQNLTLAEELYQIVSDRAAAGMAPTSERDKALVRVTTEQILSDKARRQLDTAKNRLAAMWGATDARFFEVLGKFTEVEQVPQKNQLMELVTQNPDIARWTTEIAQRQTALELARSRAIPNVTVGVGLRRFNATDENAFVLDMILPLNIFDRNQGGRLQARYNLMQAWAQKQDAEVMVHTLLTEYYNQLLAAHHEVITLSDKTLPASRSAYDAARKAFEKGLTDYLDVLDAERTYVNTERQYVNALADYHKAVAVIEGLVGQSVTK